MPKFISDDEMNKIESSAPKAKGFLSEAEMAQMEADTPSELDSLARGAAQGASFGFADELAGGTGALIRKALGDQSSLMDIYEEERNDSRDKYKTAEEANPKSYMGGQVGGAVGTALIPGLGGANLAKLGVMGAAQGLGSSEADLLKGDIAGAARDTAIGGGVGLATGGIMKGIGAGVEKLGIGNKLTNIAEDIALNPKIANANTTFGSYDTIPGKLYHGAEIVETALKKAGNLPERMGEQTRSIADDVINKEMSMDSIGKILGKAVKPHAELFKSVVDPIGNNISTHAATSAKSLGQRVADTAIGVGEMATVMPGGKAMLPIVGGSKIAGGALGAARKGLYNIADVVAQDLSRLGKFGKVLSDAAQRGGQSLGATHFILQQTNPEYRELYKNATEGEEEQ